MSIPMRWTLAAAAVAGLFWLNVPARADYLYGLVGNDTGGIIPWSPINERHRRAIASNHCACYGKYARITSVHRRYGDYIGFRCLFGAPRRPVVVTLY
jgi:hypothetical protein